MNLWQKLKICTNQKPVDKEGKQKEKNGSLIVRNFAYVELCVNPLTPRSD